VQDSALVRRPDRVGEWNGDLEQSLERHTVGRDQLVQRLALDELQRQKRRVAGLIDRVERDDIGVVERGDGSRLAFEAFTSGGSHAGRQDLESHLAAERQVLGEVDLAHPATTEEPDNSIMAERFREHRPASVWDGL